MPRCQATRVESPEALLTHPVSVTDLLSYYIGSFCRTDLYFIFWHKQICLLSVTSSSILRENRVLSVPQISVVVSYFAVWTLKAGSWWWVPYISHISTVYPLLNLCFCTVLLNRESACIWGSDHHIGITFMKTDGIDHDSMHSYN